MMKQSIDQAMADWPNKKVTDKLSTAGTQGSIIWLEERLDRLLADTADPEALQKEREAREWNAFLQDVTDQWNTFVNQNYAPAFRGPSAPKRLKTASVMAKCTKTNQFDAAKRTFKKASSDTSGVSYHTPPQEPYAKNAAGQEIRSFIYHI